MSNKNPSDQVDSSQKGLSGYLSVSCNITPCPFNI